MALTLQWIVLLRFHMMPAQPVLQGVTASVHARLSLLSEVRWVLVGLGDTGEPVLATRDKEQPVPKTGCWGPTVENVFY